MRQDDRAPFERALHRARVSAYAPGEFVGQESFMTAGEIRALAVQVGILPGVEVLDLCCAASPGPGGSSRASWAASSTFGGGCASTTQAGSSASQVDAFTTWPGTSERPRPNE